MSATQAANLLPTVPGRGSLVSSETVQQIERHVAQNIEFLDDIAVAENWLSDAKVFEAYLQDKELQRPILGARRRIEARIGQLLGEQQKDSGGRFTVSLTPETAEIDKHDRSDFRILAHALGDPRANLSVDEWRKSKRALVALLRQRLGLIPPTFCSTACRRASEYELRRIQGRLARLEDEGESLRRDHSGLLHFGGGTREERAADVAAEIAIAQRRLLELLAP